MALVFIDDGEVFNLSVLVAGYGGQEVAGIGQAIGSCNRHSSNENQSHWDVLSMASSCVQYG